MAVHGPVSPMQTPTGRIRFDRYVLDSARGCLRRGQEEIALRPKTFAVLQYLVENPQRLISKDDLFAAVWPNLAVTDDALVQSIGELRRSLGDDGPRLIKTIPRRGYRFESDVSLLSPTEATSTEAPGESPHFRARDRVAPSWFAISPARVALLTLAVLLAGAALWSSVGINWKLPDPSGPSARLDRKSPDIGAKPAIALLPFRSQSDEPARAYFADGLTQDIISALGRFSELTVMSWNAVLPYKDRPASPGEVARDLRVRYQIEGTIRHNGSRVQLTAQLVDADGRVLWSGSFDEALADLFTLQDKLNAQISGALAIRVAQMEQMRAADKPVQNLEAYDYVLRARQAAQRQSRASNVEARALLRRAIQSDPSLAAAYAALAELYYVDVSMGWAEAPTISLGHAEDMAIKAISLSESQVRARVVLGRIHIFYHRYEQAKAEIDRALAINPNDAHALAGRGNILVWLGQADAAIETLELAQWIDPELNALDRFALGLAYYLKGRYGAAIEQLKFNLLKTEGAHFSRTVLAAAYAQQNRPENVAQVVSTLRQIDPTFDPRGFGSKLLNAADLEHLRDGLRKAGLFVADADGLPSAN